MPIESKNFWINVCMKLYMPSDVKHDYVETKATLALIGKDIKGGVSPEHIAAAKYIPIEDLYDFQKVKRTSTGFTACCPFGTHLDSTPSFSVKDNKFKCFSCGEYGDSIDFMVKLSGKSFVEAVKCLNH